RIDRTEAQLAVRRAFPRPAHVAEQPAQLRRAEVGIENEARLAPQQVLRPRRPEGFAVLCGAAILPHDGAMHRPPSPIPQHRRLALVRDADAGDVVPANAGTPASRPQHAQRDAPDLLGIVLDPTRSREVLRELAVRPAADTAAPVEHQHRRPGGALVDRNDEPLRVAGQTNSPRRRLTASLTSP